MTAIIKAMIDHFEATGDQATPGTASLYAKWTAHYHPDVVSLACQNLTRDCEKLPDLAALIAACNDAVNEANGGKWEEQ